MKISPKAYSYIRFSTTEQTHGDSYRRQYELSLAYAELNGLILDESLTYKDLGVSAFDKSNVRDGQLGVFLKAVEAGLVPVGSFLLVESLDRISRATITDALEIFMAIVNRGITLVTLADGMEYSKEKINKQFTDIIISIAIMSRAHEESLIKSKRLKAAWISKRANIGKKKLTATAPGWLKISDDRTEYLVIEDKVKLVQDIFEWTKNGIGTGTITKRLNQENVPTFSLRASMWHDSYIQKILHNRAVLGEFQMHSELAGKRVPEGEPLLEYFPRIISDELFALAHSSRKSRLTHGAGRKGKGISNLFSGILRCGYCQGSMVYLNKQSAGPRGKLLVCANAKAGKNCMYIPWEYSYFEQSVLTYCQGLDLDSFLQPNVKAESETAELADKIVLMKASIDVIKNKELNIFSAVEDGAKYQQFEVRLNQLEQQRIQVEIELQSAQKRHELLLHAKVDIQKVRSNLDDFIQQMGQLSGDELYDVRSALSQQVKRIVSSIAMYPGSYIEKPAYLSALRAHLLEKGYTADEVTEHISTEYKFVANPKERFFTMVSPTGLIRVIHPSSDNPEVLNLAASGDDLAENLKQQVERVGTFIDNAKNLLRTKKLGYT
ncbi:recombinase family protein [Undibacterium sp. SXout11W]|uniref:recombinase family protein n=1 Tax=Undibacterium sp. SXout11W TaxID=3413050 RepID=UPI003BF1F2F7